MRCNSAAPAPIPDLFPAKPRDFASGETTAASLEFLNRLNRRHQEAHARSELVRYLRRGIPVLLCVEEWSHWLTAVNVEQGKFILLDSREKKVVTIADWPTLRRRWVYHEDDEVDHTVTHTFYDLHPVVPRARRQSQAQFSLARARALRRLTNRQLAELWDVYLGDLLVLCRTRTPLSQKVFSEKKVNARERKVRPVSLAGFGYRLQGSHRCGIDPGKWSCEIIGCPFQCWKSFFFSLFAFI